MKTENLDIRQTGIPGVKVTLSNFLILHSTGSWAATRYGLYRNKKKESYFWRNWEPDQHSPEFKSTEKLRLYEFLELPNVAMIEQFLRFLDANDVPYEVV